MGGLARLLKQAGHDVRGSDSGIYPPMSEQLASAKVEVMVGYDASNLAWGPDCIVVGNVCGPDHPEVLEARRRGLPLESFPSMLKRAILPGRESLVVAGTHGKTTTTSLVAWFLRFAGFDPSFLVGGVPLNFGVGSHLGRRVDGPLVLEGDEYDSAFFDRGSKFLHYHPFRAIITSIEYDHADIFPDLEPIKATFLQFIRSLDPAGDLIVPADQALVRTLAEDAPCHVWTYAVGRGYQASDADFVAHLTGSDAQRTVLDIYENGESLGRFSTHLVGQYNAANVVAALAMARRCGVDEDVLRDALARFRGVKKRQELVGIAAGVRVFFDFAHHPTAVELTSRAMRKRYPDHDLHACFEPRSSSSRRAAFASGYAQAFDAASTVSIAPVYRPEKVPEGQLLDTKTLAKDISSRGVPARAYVSIEAMCDALSERVTPGDTVLLMSSGDFGGLANMLLRALGDPVTFATVEDLQEVQDLLEGYGLPKLYPGDDVETLIIRDANTIAGCVSVQVSGETSFMFGLAVDPRRRGQGLGWVLCDIVLRRARTLGATRSVLITNTATDFFAGKIGFRTTSRVDAERDLVDSPNFRASADLVGAVFMTLSLTATRDDL